MRAFLLINPRAGKGSPTTEELAAAAAEQGVEVRVLERGEDAEAIAREADAEVLGMAGGDGSLGAVAAVAIERDLPLVCVPFGTRNHFARDVGVDRDDPLGALASFDGVERRVDVGRVNGRLFLNNVSIGMYARLVHHRERRRRRRETLARLKAIGIALRRRDPIGLTVDGSPMRARIVLVANNHYALDLLSLGERERLDDGLLHLYVANGVVRSTWTERTAPAFEISSRAQSLPVAIDGEPERLDTPLRFEIAAGALRVLVPRAEG